MTNEFPFDVTSNFPSQQRGETPGPTSTWTLPAPDRNDRMDTIQYHEMQREIYRLERENAELIKTLRNLLSVYDGHESARQFAREARDAIAAARKRILGDASAEA